MTDIEVRISCHCASACAASGLSDGSFFVISVTSGVKKSRLEKGLKIVSQEINLHPKYAYFLKFTPQHVSNDEYVKFEGVVWFPF